MPEEFLDQVDDEDRVIGRELRARIHQLGLRHRAAHILVFNGRAELFLQQRSLRKDCSPGLWDSSAAGHVDSGEDYDSCARRELYEELGINADPAPERLFKLPASIETGQEFVWVYRCRSEGPFRLHPEEIITGRWFASDELDALLHERPGDFTPTLHAIWRRLAMKHSHPPP
jgi:isopentenyl-diphosphate delta-isomerase type 1